MKNLMLLILMAQAAFGELLLLSPPQNYTNALGMELVNETVLRSRWAGDSNWNLYATSGGATYANVFGSNPVPFTASKAEEITSQLETILPKFTLPYYKYETGDYDLWFSTITNIYGAVTNYIDRFPLGDSPKSDLIHKLGDTNYGFLIHGEHLAGAVVNPYGEVTGTDGYWIKRRDRINPLVVAEWRAGGNWHFPDDNISLRHQVFYEYYRGTKNEFTLGDSQLFGLTTDQYPVFIVRLGGTNTYASGLSLSFDDVNTMAIYAPGGDDYYISWHPDWDTYANEVGYPLPHYEWTNNYLREIPWANAGANWDGGTITLNSTTQRSDRAWLDLSVPLSLHGNPPNPQIHIISNEESQIVYYTNSGDTVSLQYIDKMNTYEGNKVWDSNLFPEQLNLHGMILSNMFQTEVTWGSGRLKWVNGTLYTNALYRPDWSTNYTCLITNDYALRTNSQYIVDVDTMGLRSIIRGVSGSWMPINNIFPEEYGFVVASNYLEGISPQFRLDIIGHVLLTENFSMETKFKPPYPYKYPSTPFSPSDVPPLWEGSMERSDEVYVTMAARSVSSALSVSGLYTGTPHQVHFYAKFFLDRLTDTKPYYHLIETIPWTDASCVTSSVIDLSTNYVDLLFPLTKNIQSAENSPKTDDTKWRKLEMEDIYLPAISNIWVANTNLNVLVSTSNISESFSCEITLTNGFTVSSNGTPFTNSETFTVTDVSGAEAGMLGSYYGATPLQGHQFLNNDEGASGYAIYYGTPAFTDYIYVETPSTFYEPEMQSTFTLPVECTDFWDRTKTALVSVAYTYATNWTYTTNWITTNVTNDFTTNYIEKVFNAGLTYTNVAFLNRFEMHGWEAYYENDYGQAIPYYQYTNYSTATSYSDISDYLSLPTTSNSWSGPTNWTNCTYAPISLTNGMDITLATNSPTFSITSDYPVFGPIDPPYEICGPEQPISQTLTSKTYTLPEPCAYGSNTVGWASSEGISSESGDVSIVRSNNVSIKVLVEWQR